MSGTRAGEGPHDDEIWSIVVRILDELFERDVSDLEMNTRLDEDLGLDSLDAVAFVVELQDELTAELVFQEIGDIATIAQIVDLARSATLEPR